MAPTALLTGVLTNVTVIARHTVRASTELVFATRDGKGMTVTPNGCHNIAYAR